MEILMPIKFHGNYVLSIRCGDSEARERCQKLTIRALTPEERDRSYQGLSEAEMPTHQVTFYDFGCKRIIEGKIRDNEKEKVAFQVKEKTYEFSPFVPKQA